MQVIRISGAALGMLALFTFGLAGCGKSERITRFEKAAQAVCDCKDAECAKKAGGDFADENTKLAKEDVDWTTAQGKKESAAITEAAKTYHGCLNKHETRDVANKACTEDAKGKTSTAACTACCRDHGRMFDYWVDPTAASIAGALGGPKNKGCGCK